MILKKRPPIDSQCHCPNQRRRSLDDMDHDEEEVAIVAEGDSIEDDTDADKDIGDLPVAL